MRWFHQSRRGTKTFTFSRDMTPEELEETTARMDEAFARMDDAFDKADEAFKLMRRVMR